MGTFKKFCAYNYLRITKTLSVFMLDNLKTFLWEIYVDFIKKKITKFA